MRKALFYLITLLLVISIVVLGLHVVNVFNINVKGTVNVIAPSVMEHDIELNITAEKGSKTFDLGVVEIPGNGTIQIKAQLLEYSGDLRLLLSGVIEMKSESKSYKINMPCLVNINEPCYRIMVVTPGYDEPMPIEKGRYNVTLILEWVAGGTGNFCLKITGIYREPT